MDAVRHFLADIWPAVRAAVPAAEFHLVGAAGDAVRAAVAAAPGGVLRGFVDDLADTYATAAVSRRPDPVRHRHAGQDPRGVRPRLPGRWRRPSGPRGSPPCPAGRSSWPCGTPTSPPGACAADRPRHRRADRGRRPARGRAAVRRRPPAAALAARLRDFLAAQGGRMRITFVCGASDLSGGSRVISVYADLLHRRGHTVTIVSRPRRRFSKSTSSSRGSAAGPCPEIPSRGPATTTTSAAPRTAGSTATARSPPPTCPTPTWSSPPGGRRPSGSPPTRRQGAEGLLHPALRGPRQPAGRPRRRHLAAADAQGHHRPVADGRSPPTAG